MLIVRDISLVLVSVYYTHRALRSLKLDAKNTEQEDLDTVLDFEIMLVSTLPLKYFSQFLEADKPELQIYMRMIFNIRLISEEGQLLEEKRAIAERESGYSVSSQRAQSLYSSKSKRETKLEKEILALQDQIKKREKQAYNLAK